MYEILWRIMIENFWTNCSSQIHFKNRSKFRKRNLNTQRHDSATLAWSSLERPHNLYQIEIFQWKMIRVPICYSSPVNLTRLTVYKTKGNFIYVFTCVLTLQLFTLNFESFDFIFNFNLNLNQHVWKR